MDKKTLDRAMELTETMRRIKEAMDAWEKAEAPIVPDSLRGGFLGGSAGSTGLPPPSKDAWQVYRRTAIKDLELAHDKAKAEFDKL